VIQVQRQAGHLAVGSEHHRNELGAGRLCSGAALLASSIEGSGS
jgi:hypothetical protein